MIRGLKLPTLDVVKKDLAFTSTIVRQRPFNCLIQVTNRCNMKCSFCDFWPNPAAKHEELTVADFERIGRELAEVGTFLVSIEGGEPFARKDLVDIVRALSEKHLTALFTNGWYVTEDNARALWDAGLTHASVSIDYASAARHDEKRRLTGTTDRAWRAVEIFRDTAPRGGKQAHVMTVLMADNAGEMEELFEQSARRGAGHQVTLLSVAGHRRGKSAEDRLPPPGTGERLARLWDRYPHVRFFREYFERIDAFVAGGPMPTCTAGAQSLNIDHVGNVSSCIERIDRSVGNVRDASVVELHRRLVADREEVSRCQQCWTACRGIQQALGDGGSARNLLHLAQRTRSY